MFPNGYFDRIAWVVWPAYSLVVLIVVGSIAVGAPVVVYAATGKRAAHVLVEWKAWLEAEHAIGTFVVFLIFGVVPIDQRIGGL